MPKSHALLLTDVVDSTRLAEAIGDAAMADLWVAHNRLARDLLAEWNGREIDKADGMLLLFDSVDNAANFSLSYHRAIADRRLPVSARAGIHFGPVSIRANVADDVARGAKLWEVDGVALPIVARVMSIALGGQTLLSADARLALSRADQRVQSHGHWRMQGIAEPIELFEIAEPGVPIRVPADVAKAYRVLRKGDLWQPARDMQHTLPAERDPFVGRHRELQLLAMKLSARARLVSVLGMGGTGKTRLVTRFAWTARGEYPGGVWFCDLSQARSVDDVVSAVAQGLDLQLGKADPVDQLASAISGRGKCLVILDNFEQVARHAEDTLGVWLGHAPGAQFLVTTREVLGIAGEQILDLEPLIAQDGIELFLRRAEAATQSFAPGADDLAAVDQLVKVLDGLPLAIELAAARVRVMSPRHLLARMSNLFDVLHSRAGRRDRQATLRAAFDWSWEPLSAPEKAALAKLSVFHGGFTLESASAVIKTATATQPDAADIVQWLVDKSFVRQVGGDRFDLLETVREYAAQHLRTVGRFEGSGADCETAARASHWRYFATLSDSAVMAHRCIEVHNLVVACGRAAASDPESAVGALQGAWAALRMIGPFRAVSPLVQAIESGSPPTPRQQCLIDRVMGNALALLGDARGARARADSCLVLATKAGDLDTQVTAICQLADLDMAAGEYSAAARRMELAMGLARRSSTSTTLWLALNQSGALQMEFSQLDRARQDYAEAFELAKAAGDLRWQGGLQGNLGTIAQRLGRLPEARSHYEAALSTAQEIGDRQWEGNTRSNLGLLLHEMGRHTDARDELEHALQIALSIGHRQLEAMAQCNLGIVLEALDDRHAAAQRYAEAVAVAQALANLPLEGQFCGYWGLCLAYAGDSGRAAECLQRAVALLASGDDVVSLGIAHCQQAMAAALRKDGAASHAAAVKAEALLAPLALGADSEAMRLLARAKAAI